MDEKVYFPQVYFVIYCCQEIKCAGIEEICYFSQNKAGDFHDRT